MAETDHKVTVFTSEGCGFCKMVKAYLDSKQIPFNEIDVGKDPEAAAQLVQRTGQAGVPVTVFYDTDMVVGFDRGQIDSFIKIHKLG